MRCCDPTYYLHIGQIKWEVVQNRKVGAPPPHHVFMCVRGNWTDKLHKLHTHTQKVKVLDYCGLPRQWGEWSVGGLNSWPGPLSGGRGAEGGCLHTIHQLECVSLWQLQPPLRCNEPTNTPSLKGST